MKMIHSFLLILTLCSCSSTDNKHYKLKVGPNEYIELSSQTDDGSVVPKYWFHPSILKDENENNKITGVTLFVRKW